MKEIGRAETVQAEKEICRCFADLFGRFSNTGQDRFRKRLVGIRLEIVIAGQKIICSIAFLLFVHGVNDSECKKVARREDGIITESGFQYEFAETLSRLREEGKRIVYLTNNSSRTRAEYVEKLTRLGNVTGYLLHTEQKTVREVLARLVIGERGLPWRCTRNLRARIPETVSSRRP